jgi:hypothetical protein
MKSRKTTSIREVFKFFIIFFITLYACMVKNVAMAGATSEITFHVVIEFKLLGFLQCKATKIWLVEMVSMDRFLYALHSQ